MALRFELVDQMVLAAYISSSRPYDRCSWRIIPSVSLWTTRTCSDRPLEPTERRSRFFLPFFPFIVLGFDFFCLRP